MGVLKSFGWARPAKDEDTTSRSDGDDSYDGTAEEAMFEVEVEAISPITSYSGWSMAISLGRLLRS
jgi:hypothetical protein